MKKTISTIFFFFIFIANMIAQEEFITPSRFLTRFKFSQLTGGVVLLKAQLSARPDTLQFILDSGSGGISLDSATTSHLGLLPQESDKTIRGIGGVRKVGFLYNKSLLLPGLQIDSLNFHVNNYEILSAVYGEKIDGIIGYSVLNRYIIKIDYDSLYVEFWSKGSLKYPRGGFILRPLISTLPTNFVRVTDDASFDARFLFDIGAGLNLMLSTDFIKDSAILKKSRKMYLKAAQGVGGKVDMHITVIKEVKLGPYKFRNVPIYIFNDEFNITSYPYLGGILGNDLLRRFNLILNYEKREFHLMPNSHYNESFDYSYTGIELYFLDGHVVIGDVAEGSPAALGGLQEGDVVIAINKNFVQSIQLFKATLQNAFGKVKILIFRNGQLLEIEFKIKNILK